jgi:ABC-type arginine transport system permease subunit
MNSRGQSVGIGQFLLTLVVGGVVIYLVTVMGKAILPGAQKATGNETANQATTWLQTVPDLLPIIILVIGFVSLIVLAIFQREIR